MTVLGLHQPGESMLHRCPAGWKLLALVALAVTVLLVHSPIVLGAVVLAVACGYPLARITPRRCWRTARALLTIMLVVFGLQWWLLGLASAAVVSLRLAAALGAATLFTQTTKVDDVITAVARGLRPLRRLGVRPERIGLLVGLTVHAIAELATIASEVRQAQRARGAQRSVPAFAVPLLVRTLRHADELGEALAARGFDD